MVLRWHAGSMAGNGAFDDRHVCFQKTAEQRLAIRTGCQPSATGAFSDRTTLSGAASLTQAACTPLLIAWGRPPAALVIPEQCLIDLIAEIGAEVPGKERAQITTIPTSRDDGVNDCEPQAMPDAPFGPSRTALPKNRPNDLDLASRGRWMRFPDRSACAP